MDQTTPEKVDELSAQSRDKLYMENTLLRISGALFCHDAKRASTRTQQIEINKTDAAKHIVIRPDVELGQPGPLAHKVFVALIKKHSDYGRPVQDEVSFTKRELMRLVGRKQWGGSDSEQLLRAITQIQTTLVCAHFRDNAGHYVEERFNIFSKTRIARREFASDPIEACTIALAEPIVSALRDEHFTCLNYALMMRLGTIGQALYMRLFFHFANLYDGRNEARLVFPKRYDDICNEWLGGLTIVRSRSKILDRLSPHLDLLVTERFLAAYAINKAKTREGFVITFKPGTIFFQDYDRFYRARRQGDHQVEFHADKRDVGEPLRVAYLFAEKRTGRKVDSITYVPTKDVETAKQFLKELAFAEMPRFVEYALSEANRTNFDVQTLGGIRQYLAGYIAHRARRKAQQARHVELEAKSQMDARKEAYERDRRLESARLFESLPEGERNIIEGAAADRAKKFSGSLRGRMLEFNRALLTIERHGDKLTGFEQWCSGRGSQGGGFDGNDRGF